MVVGDSAVATRRLKRRFWLISLSALLAVLLTLRLGVWQLSRADQKHTLQSDIDSRQRLPALGNQDVLAALPGVDLAHRRVTLRGHWLADKTVYLDNRQMAGKPGFFVLTPLKLDGSDLAVVIQRGWVQRSFVDRTALPALQTAAGSVVIEGRIAPAPAKLYELGASKVGHIRQNLDLPGFALEIAVPLSGYSVLQSGASGDGLAREWPSVNTGVEKHYGYAFQFFALCGLIAGLYIWFQIVRRIFHPR